MPSGTFDTSVFINCPFDQDYEPILQAILFCVMHLGFVPTLATERIDSLESRLHKIQGMIEGSRFSIHDLRRCQATEKDEYFRLNMPFELGIDYGCRLYGGGRLAQKRVLILEEQPYRYRAALSDLSGCDIAAHGGSFEMAVRRVRNWLANEGGAPKIGAQAILDDYADFGGWHYDRQLKAGFSKEDIEIYPTRELLDSMIEWFARRPVA